MAKDIPIKLVQVNARLFSDDVAKVKQLASVERIRWQEKLRLLVHGALNAPTLKIR